MNNVLRSLHAGWAMLMFVILFLMFMPFFMVPILVPKWHHLTGKINRLWGRVFFPLIFIPFEIELRYTPEKNSRYIFCPNHFSYLDIPSMGLNPVDSIFVGKSDMEKIPLFGFMYRKLHITVDRQSLKSRYTTVVRANEALREGKNLVIFPEGGILTDKPPHMTRFKDGAFRVAIEQQIPIVPVTIPYNWIILPDYTFLPRRHLMKVIFHEPIETKGKTINELKALKEETYQVIDQELKKYNHENR